MLGPFWAPSELIPSPSTFFLFVCLLGFCFSEEEKGLKKKKARLSEWLICKIVAENNS